jgi:hypothetical protein
MGCPSVDQEDQTQRVKSRGGRSGQHGDSTASGRCSVQRLLLLTTVALACRPETWQMVCPRNDQEEQAERERSTGPFRTP